MLGSRGSGFVGFRLVYSTCIWKMNKGLGRGWRGGSKMCLFIKCVLFVVVDVNKDFEAWIFF